MKKNRLLSAAMIAAFAVSAGACDDGLAELNDNPNAPTDVPTQFLLPQAIQSTVEYAGYNTWFTLEFTGLFAQHWAKIQYTEEDRYELRPNVVDGFWNTFYPGPMKDWQTIIEKGQESGIVNHEAIGMIGKVYMAHLITDIWGDVPYSEALKADDPENPTIAPAYDAQQAIYTAMLAELDQAASMLDPARQSFGQEDLIYGGDVDKWEQFANSLRLRLAMRISDVAPATAQPIVEALASRPLILDNEDNFTLQYLDAAPNRNPLFENAAVGSGSRDDHAVSNTLVNLMGALNDPRIAVYAEPATVANPTATFEWCDGVSEPCHATVGGEVYRGIRNGVNSGDVPEPFGLWSRPGNHFRSNPNAAQPLLTAAEVHFLLAEAALNGWGGGTLAGMTAQQHYEAGIRAAFDMWDGADGVDLGDGVQTAYLAQPGVTWGTGDSMLEQIIEQKWLALYTVSPEAYAELRRTGYPDEAVASIDAQIISVIPGRIPYPDIEQSLNRDNLQAAIAAQSSLGVDGSYNGRVWWDTTPQSQ